MKVSIFPLVQIKLILPTYWMNLKAKILTFISDKSTLNSKEIFRKCDIFSVITRRFLNKIPLCVILKKYFFIKKL